MMNILLAALLSSSVHAAPAPERLPTLDTPVASAAPGRNSANATKAKKGSGGGRKMVSLTLRPGVAFLGRGDLQMDFRVTKKLALVGHGVVGKTSGWTKRTTDSQGNVTTDVQAPGRRVSAGMGAKYSFKNFKRGAFVGFDVDMNEDTYGDLGSATILRAIPRVGWKTTGQRGLTFCVDLGVGFRSVDAESAAVEAQLIPGSLAARFGTRVGWSI